MTKTTLVRQSVDGFATLTLRNAVMDFTLVPELGARIISLRSHRSKREWLWRPGDGRGLFACAPETAFEDGPIVGIDECIPTVSPCTVGGVSLHDHGEVWTRPWEVQTAADESSVTTSIRLATTPLVFTRRVTLDGDAVRLDYTLANTRSSKVRYLWALHPLFTLKPQDRVEVTGESSVLVTEARGSTLVSRQRGPWPTISLGIELDRMAITGSPANAGPSYCKAFLATKDAPEIALVDSVLGEKLSMSVDPAQVGAWGYWLSLGAWHGHTHIALEASNAQADALDELTTDDPAHTLGSREVRTWQVTIRLQSSR